MTRKIDLRALGVVVALTVTFGFLNYNSALQRYNDQIDACEFNVANAHTPNRDGWQAAHDARLAAYLAAPPSQQTPDNPDYIAYHEYAGIVAKLDLLVETPCRDRYDRPGVLG